jgi:hypothetical protein
VASAATLSSYFDFTQYGTVSGGSTVTSNVLGNTSGTLSSSGTTLNSSGLAVALGNTVPNTGLPFNAGSLSSFTGDFSLQIWYTMNATLNTDIKDHDLFGGTTSASIDGTLVGDQGLVVAYNNNAGTPQFIRPIIGNNTQYGTTVNPPIGTGMTPSTLYDLTLTYNSTSHNFTLYMNGVSVASGAPTTYFTSLAAVTNFAIGGVSHPAFGDGALAQTTTSFLMYTGELTGTQVADIHAFGSTPTMSQLGTVVTVPEPGTFAMLLGGIGMLALFRRRGKRATS